MAQGFDGYEEIEIVNMNVQKLIGNLTRETQPDRFGKKLFCVSRGELERFKNSNYSKEILELIAQLHGLLDIRIPNDFDFCIYIDNGELEIELVHCFDGGGEEVGFPVPYDDNMNNTLAMVDWAPLRVLQ